MIKADFVKLMMKHSQQIRLKRIKEEQRALADYDNAKRTRLKRYI